MHQNLCQAFRNPLSSIAGYVDFLFQYSRGMSREHQRDLIRVRDAARQMNRLVDSFLMVAAFDLGVARLKTARVDLVEVVRDAAEEMEEWLSQSRVTLQADLGRRPLPIEGDPGLLRALVRCLVSNATQASPQGSTVCLRLAARNGRARVQVRDQGMRPVEPLRNAFRPFLEARRPRDGSRPDTGGGLELALAKHIAGSHGGRAWAGAGPHGLTVNVELPLRRRAPR